MIKDFGTRINLRILIIFVLLQYISLFITTASAQQTETEADTCHHHIHEKPLSHIPFTYELDNSTTNGTSACPNSDFSQGDFTNWVGHYGTFNNPSQNTGFVTIPPNERHLIIPAPGTVDPYGTNVAGGPETLLTVFPGEAFSARLGNSATGGQAEQLSYDITIGPNTDFFIYRYAVVLNHNEQHTAGQRASFEINIIDKATGLQYDPICGYYYVYAQPNLPGWYTSPLGGGSNNLPVYWKDWTTVGLGFDVSDYGKQLTIVFTTKDCSPGGHFGYAYISAFCSSLSVSFQGCEGSNTVTMTGPPGFAEYLWTGPYCPTCTPLTVGTTPSITITNASTGDEYRLRLVSFFHYPDCVIQKVTSTVAFTQMDAEFSSSINCIGNPSTFTDESVINQNATNERVWDFGDGSPPVTVTTATTTHTFATAGSYDVKLKRSTTDPCQDSITHTIVVATLPPVVTNTPMSKSICSGSNVDINLTFSVPSAIATWTRTVTTGTATITNIPATQSGSLINDLIVNSTNTDAVVTYTLTPKIGNCIGLPVTYVVTVHPIPTVSAVANQTFCNGVPAPATILSSPVGASTVFTWTNSNPSIGLAASGTGDIPAFTATNTTSAAMTGNITITPTANGCTGPSLVYTVTVNPTPTVNPISDQAFCNGAAAPSTTLSSPVGAGTTFSWTNNNATVGLAVSGSGNIPGFTATNAGNTPVPAVITIVPTASTCVGQAATYTIIVNPTPTVSAIANQTYCNLAVAPVTTLSSPVGAGTTFSWSNNNTGIGLAAAGSGDIPTYTATNPGNSPVTATITVNPAANSCTGTPLTYTVTVNPTPTVNPLADQTYCNTALAPVTSLSSPVGAGTTFSWTNSNISIGLAASGTGQVPGFTATNTGIVPSNATITITPTANSCTGTPLTYGITVNPTPTVNTVSDQIFCNGAAAPVTPLSSPVGSGTTFSWINNNPAIGLAANGTGDIPGFVATNASNIAVGASVTITPTANACTGTPFTYNIIVNPTPTVNSVSNQTFCNGVTAPVTPLSSPVGAGTTFSWSNSNTSVGLGAGGTGNVPGFTATNTGTVPITATITITPTAEGCQGIPLTYTITVNPTPAVNPISDQTYCNSVITTVTNVSSPVGSGTTFSWSNTNAGIGLSLNGTGDIPSFTATNGGTSPISGTITITPTANSCVGTPSGFVITVNPTPAVNPISNQVYCNGVSAPLTTVSSGVGSSATFSWVNNLTSIGLAPSGTGNIPAFTATNPGSSPVIANITITPTANSCVGPALSYTVTVNPTPTVNPVSNQTYCNGVTATETPVSSPVGAGTTFSWSNNNASIGLPATGSGNVPGFTATNNGTSPVLATITITPTANSCVGIPLTYTITVNPTPTVNPVTNQTFCNTVTAPVTPLSSPVGSGTTFTWTNSNTLIGLSSGGNGDIPSYTASNTGTVPISGTITITPVANACIGIPLSYTVVVNPTPTVDFISDQTYCNTVTAPVTTLTSPVGTGTTFTWTNDNITIGLTGNGTGNVPSFTASNTGAAPISAHITVTPTANACIGTSLTYQITVNPTPAVFSIANQTYCNTVGVPVTPVAGPVAGSSYSWVNSNSAVGLGNSGSGNIPAFTATNPGIAPIMATVTITPQANGCGGIPINYSITVNPTPGVDQVANQTYCNGVAAPITTVTSPVGPGTTFSWTNSNTTIGLSGTGTGNIPGFTTNNTGTIPVNATIVITPTANACVGIPTTYTITVNPTPHLLNSQPSVICSGTTLNIPLLQDVSGSSFTWTAGCLPIGTVTGFTSNQITGTNSITDQLTNTGNVVSTVDYLITPHANGCSGTATGLTVPVNPVPVISCTASQSICSGTAFNPVVLNSTVSGTDYSWSATCPVGNVNPCPVAPGISNPIPAVTFLNVTNVQQVVAYTINSSFQGCPGNSVSHTITINPSPTVTNWPLAQTICSGQSSTAVNLSSTVTGTTFSWTASSASPISGFTLTGTDVIPVQTLFVPPGTSGFVTYHIIPSFTGGTSCPGAPTDYLIHVNPLPVPAITGAATVCELQPGVVYSTASTAGNSYHWSVTGTTSVTGTASNTITVTWGPYTVSPGSMSVTETIDATGCSQTTANYPVSILQRPIPTLSGPLAACDGSTGNIYQTEAGMNNYSWTIAGGSIVSGGGTGSHNATVTWNTTGTQWIEVNYINAMGCPGFPAKNLPVTVYTLPNSTISEGAGPNCELQQHSYHTPTDPACTYQWTISPSSRGMISAGQGTNNITIDWLSSGNATIGVTSTNGTTTCVSNGSYPLVIHPKPIPVFNVPCFDLVTTPSSKKIILRGGNPYLAGQSSYTGNRVSFNSTTGNFEFDPFGATPGIYPITYSFTNNFGCSAATAPISITVSNNYFNCGGDLTDIRDGKKYKTVMLSGRCWMRENLSFGTILASPSGPVQTDNCIAEKYCAPTDPNCTTYGGMYQWDEMMDYSVIPGSKGICPPEWHVPTEAEWQSLIDNVLTGVGAPTANALSGSTLKDAIVTGSFYAMLSGMNYNNNTWSYISGTNTGTQFWTSTAKGAHTALSRGLNIYTPSISSYSGSRGNAFSLRCLKD